MKRLRSEDGSASLEFIIIAVGVLLPLTYFVLTVSAIHRAHAAAAHAVREASRILMRADSFPAGNAAARDAAALAFADHGLAPPEGSVRITCTGACLAPGTQASVDVSWDMPLPWIPEGLDGPVTWPIRDSQTLVFDLYRSDPV